MATKNKKKLFDQKCSSNDLLKFINCRILNYEDISNDGKGKLYNGEVTIDTAKGVIVNITKLKDDKGCKRTIEERDEMIEIYDCEGKILSPGFIDLQLNGAFGIDFSISQDVNYSSIEMVSNRLLTHGVTSFCPTLISCEPTTYHSILPTFSNYIQTSYRKYKNQSKRCSARILGLHLEGPFFELSKRGAHPQSCILDPIDGIETCKKVYGDKFLKNDEQLEENGYEIPGLIRIITLAPERPGALKAIQQITQRQTIVNGSNNGNSTLDKHSNSQMKKTSVCSKPTKIKNMVVISCGHTNATYEEGLEALKNGASLITHMFNAMRPFHHREPGLLGLLTDKHLGQKNLEDAHNNHVMKPYYSIIADGIHVNPLVVQMAYSLHPSGLILVTDAMSAMGLDDGIHTLGHHMQILKKGSKATIVGTETLAGSVVSMDACVRALREFTGCALEDALLAATTRPSELINWELGGKIKIGCVADLILLDDDLNVLECWIDGTKVQQKVEIL